MTFCFDSIFVPPNFMGNTKRNTFKRTHAITEKIYNRRTVRQKMLCCQCENRESSTSGGNRLKVDAGVGKKHTGRYVTPKRLISETPMELLCIQSERAMTLTKIAIDPAIIDFFIIGS